MVNSLFKLFMLFVVTSNKPDRIKFKGTITKWLVKQTHLAHYETRKAARRNTHFALIFFIIIIVSTQLCMHTSAMHVDNILVIHCVTSH